MKTCSLAQNIYDSFDSQITSMPQVEAHDTQLVSREMPAGCSAFDALARDGKREHRGYERAGESPSKLSSIHAPHCGARFEFR